MNSTPADETFAAIVVETEDITNGSEDASMIFSVYDAGVFENILELSGEKGVVINEDSRDVNFRVETNGDSHFLFVDGGVNRMSIGASTNTPAALLEVSNGTTDAETLLLLDNNDADQICLDIDASNTTAVTVDIDALNTTANVIDIQANGLTSGAALNINSNHDDVTTRTLVKVTNDHTGANNVTLLELVNDAPAGQNILKISTVSELMTPATIRIEDANDPSVGLNAFNCPIIDMARTNTTTQDDQLLGGMTFKAKNSSGSEHQFASILVESTDVTANDECGKIKFFVTHNSVNPNELLSIGGSDLSSADTSIPEVVINESGIESNFRVETQNNTDMFFVDGSNDTVSVGGSAPSNHGGGFAVLDDLHSVTMGGLTAGQYHSGKVLRYSPGSSSSLTAGQVFYLKASTSTWTQARASTQANAEGTNQLLCLGLGGNPQTVGVLLEGIMRVAAAQLEGTFAVGAPVYVSDTDDGHITFTIPSSSNDFVRVIGFGLERDAGSGDCLIYFKPDNTHVVVA